MNEKQQKILKYLFYAQLLIEAQDDLKDTVFFKGKIKQHGKILINLISPELNRQLKAIHEADPTMYINVMNNIDELQNNMSKADLPDLVMVNQIFNHYRENKEDWNNLFECEFNKVDE